MIPCSSSSFNSIAAANGSMFKNSSSHSRSVYAAYLKDMDVFVGIITLKRYDARNRRAEIDYIVAEEQQRKGFASEMVKFFLEDVFQKWRLERISVFLFLENEPSCKLLEKLNFNKEGILRHWTCVDDIFYDSYSYSLILSYFEKYRNTDQL